MNEAFNENIDNGGDVNEVLSLSPTSLLRAKMRAKFQRPSLDQARENLKTPIQKDLDRYESYSLADSNVDILEWWRTHENTLPILSQIAKQVLTIPASSAKSERVFSTGGNIVTKKRNRLNPELVETLILIKENDKKVTRFKEINTYMQKNLDSNPLERITIETSIRQKDNDDSFREFCVSNLDESLLESDNDENTISILN